RIDRVTKKFDETVAVDDVSLNIRRGEIFALLGGSGSGKSTLLRMLAGFEKPTSGRIYLDGEDITDLPPYERPINMMFQSYALFPHMTVAQNIAFGLKQDKLPKAEIEQRVQEMLKLVHMEQYGKRKPHQLSGGQRQRVALARSLAKRPKVLLLDEPLGALDRKLREETQFELIDLQQQLGLTFLVVTHDQDEAMTMADRIAVMDHGEVLQVAPPSTIYESPSNRFVASFIGSINLFEGTARKEGGALSIEAEDGFRIRTELPGEDLEGQRVSFAIRPEKIRISREPPSETGHNAVAGEVW